MGKKGGSETRGYYKKSWKLSSDPSQATIDDWAYIILNTPPESLDCTGHRGVWYPLHVHWRYLVQLYLAPVS